MIAFAANSLLARAALIDTEIDPVAFSVVRLVSGAVFLLMFVAWRKRGVLRLAGSWWSALALFVYAVAFSWSYVRLSAGAGALLLFGCVQITMLLFGWVKGCPFQRAAMVWILRRVSWAGVPAPAGC